jgi:membrane associated rhomboid family serine protease
MNSLVLFQSGIYLERSYGTIRIATIYFISGISGFMFGSTINGLVPSVGASGSLFGMISCILLDLLNNFKLVKNRWKELGKLSLQIIISLFIGFFPYINNFAHIGGFITGILSGFLILPAIHFGKWDKIIKNICRVSSGPFLIAFIAYLYTDFYYGRSDTCSWCKYLDCLPFYNWCDEYQ